MLLSADAPRGRRRERRGSDSCAGRWGAKRTPISHVAIKTVMLCDMTSQSILDAYRNARREACSPSPQVLGTV